MKFKDYQEARSFFQQNKFKFKKEKFEELLIDVEKVKSADVFKNDFNDIKELILDIEVAITDINNGPNKTLVEAKVEYSKCVTINESTRDIVKEHTKINKPETKDIIKNEKVDLNNKPQNNLRIFEEDKCLKKASHILYTFENTDFNGTDRHVLLQIINRLERATHSINKFLLT